jgi:hypothetical protein
LIGFNVNPEVKEFMMTNFQNRIIQAAKLNVNLYEEVESDRGALGQAMGVVALSAVAAGIGSIGTKGAAGIVIGTIAALIGWYIWAYITYFVGTKFFPEPQTKADHGELLRTIGFSSAPGILRILGIIPFLYGIIFFISGVWMLVAMIIAVRQALDYKSTLRAVGVCIIGWIIQGVIFWLVFAIFGGFGKPL